MPVLTFLFTEQPGLLPRPQDAAPALRVAAAGHHLRRWARHQGGPGGRGEGDNIFCRDSLQIIRVQALEGEVTTQLAITGSVICDLEVGIAESQISRASVG